ncbi:hypothetical protein [Campylobacter corcagiensis]|uniref:Uncharacterized protein n=1 Tax=Campylobacter corcagiensis TaxID=1448857 RepID=A0A7M1LFZ3_9BACT|nr:hypothetical protein [Campylobacter corcagiensis]QKF65030.1 putative membrane protein [Campylobacter corcagiensis]QOQ86816.1 hypothetical protein IMC76_06255 [Campylobacter corcagiensis]
MDNNVIMSKYLIDRLTYLFVCYIAVGILLYFINLNFLSTIFDFLNNGIIPFFNVLSTSLEKVKFYSTAIFLLSIISIIIGIFLCIKDMQYRTIDTKYFKKNESFKIIPNNSFFLFCENGFLWLVYFKPILLKKRI